MTHKIRFEFVESFSRSIILSDEPSQIENFRQEIDCLLHKASPSCRNAKSQPYIEKIKGGYEVNYAGFMKIMSAIGCYMKQL